MDTFYETDGLTKHNMFNVQREFDDYEDFVFSNKDTIGVVLLFKYKKNDEIRIPEFFDINEELAVKDNNTSGFDTYQDIKVTHNIAVLGLRLLYTLNIEYLFYHHFFQNINMDSYKKSDYLTLNNNADYDPFANYKNTKKGKKKRKPTHSSNLLNDLISEMDNKNSVGKSQSFEQSAHTKRVLFMVLDVEKPQFNFQNELSNSQLLLVGKGTMKVHLYDYLLKDPQNSRKKHSIKKQIK